MYWCKIKVFLLFIIVVIILINCPKPPNQKIFSARKTLLDAVKVKGNIYEPEKVKRAEELILLAKDKTAKKQYDEAYEYAVAAERLAASIFESAVERKKQENKLLLRNQKLFKQYFIEDTITNSISNDTDKTNINVETSTITVKQEYNKLMSLLKIDTSLYTIHKFMFFIDKHPNTDYTDNVIYWLGEIYYKNGNWDRARHIFIDLINRFPKQNKIPDATLKIALTYLAENNNHDAKIWLKKVIDDYKDKPVYEIAIKKLARLENSN